MPDPLVLSYQNQTKGAGMRTKSSPQMYLSFGGESTLKIVKEYRRKYAAIGELLRKNPSILSAAHLDLAASLSVSSGGRRTKYTSDEILRALIVMFIDGDSYRDVVVRIENSDFLRDFVGLHVSIGAKSP